LTAPVSLTPDQEKAAARIDALDLEPVVFGLMHPDPGLTVMGLAEADQIIAAYRGWLKLCAWYPGEPLVPALPIDEAWRAHLADTAKYARDCQAAFGTFAHCYPYYGHDTRRADWRSAYGRARDLFRRHFGTDMPGTFPGYPEEAHPGADCCTGGSGCVLVFGGLASRDGAVTVLDRERPRPPRGRPPAPAARWAEPVLTENWRHPAGTAPMPCGPH
jgi:hypothetical protein